MATPLATARLGGVPRRTAGIFEACGDDVDEAPAAHFGRDTAVDRTGRLPLAEP